MNFRAFHLPALSRLNSSAIRPLLLAFSASRQVATLAALLTITPAYAATKYWSNNGNTPGGDGIWNTTTSNHWATAIGGPWTLAWVNGSDTADNNSGTANITLGENITLGGFIQGAGGSFGGNSNSIEQGSGPYTLTLDVTGANTFLAAANSTTGRSLNVNAAIAGGGGNNLVLAGPSTSSTGNIALGRANTFSGTTSFSSGATGGIHVFLKHQLALQNSSVILSSDVILTFDSSVSANAFTFGGLVADSAGSGFDLALQNNNASTPIALTVGGNNNTTAYSGVLSGGGSLIKTGSGTLILDGANTYSGITTVSAGTLQVDGITVSPTTVNSGATLAGGGQVNAAVTVDAGGSLDPGSSLTAGDGISGTLVVSSLTFSGTGTVDVGTLSGYTSAAAIMVTGGVTFNGAAGAVTLNLPATPGFNGIYHLLQFGSGTVPTTMFTLGTVPALNAFQTGTLQLNGSYLDYAITASGDTTPPIVRSTDPANNATSVLPGTDLVVTFNETIVAGSGSIELHRSSDESLVESFDVTSSPQLAFSTAQLIIQPTNVLAPGTYYVRIPAGAVKDTSGNNYPGITSATGWQFTVPVPVVLYTDTGSPTNPTWSAIVSTLPPGNSYNGTVNGSLINVNNPAVEVGLYGNRPISLGSKQRIEVACNATTTSVFNFSRWFQTHGNTQVLRVFPGDANTATARAGVSLHCMAFRSTPWTSGTTNELTCHYTFAHLTQGYTCFQLFNTGGASWALMLGITTSGQLKVAPRNAPETFVTNSDGSVKNFKGRGFDFRIIDDGNAYKLWIDGVLYASQTYDRPLGKNNFMWGMYYGENNLHPPADYNLVMVSGAQEQSWAGNLGTPVTATVKDNNTTNLDTGTSWVGGVIPGLYNQATWDSTVTAANTTTLASSQEWAGLQILNPGGPVTINGTNNLVLDASGVDLTAATQNLAVNCPVQLTVPNPWGVASGRTATFNGIISGYPGITVSGGGTVQLNAANTYIGNTTISGGTLEANNNSALGAGLVMLNGGSLSNSASCALGNDVNLSSDATVGVAASQTLTLNGAIASTGNLTKNGAGRLTLSGANTYTGATIVSSGTLAIGNTGALLTTTSLMLADATMLQPNLDGVIISAPITLGGSGTTATISAPTNAPGGGIVSTFTLNSVLGGSGNATFSSSVNQNALSTVYLGAQSSYVGSTKLDTAGTTESQIILKLGMNNALPMNTVLTIDGQTGAGTGRFAELNLNGYSQQLAGLTNVTHSFRFQRVVNSNISAAATLTVNNSGNHTFSGNLGSNLPNGSVTAVAMPGSTNGNNFGLIKSGAGTFTLTGSNTYSGNTTVSQGTLSLGVINPSNETSTVTIAATGATLNLTFSGTDTVSKLFIGTSQMAAGVYEAVGNPGSGIEIPQLSGTGTLTVTSGPPVTGYTTWKIANGTNQTLDLDHDNDGVSNGIEYFLGGSTNTTGFTTLPGVTNTAGTFSITWTKAADYTGAYGTDFAVETSTTLAAPWTTETLGVNVVITGNNVKYTFPAGTIKFARLKVTGP